MGAARGRVNAAFAAREAELERTERPPASRPSAST